MNARAALESVADYIEARNNYLELNHEELEETLSDIAERFARELSEEAK